MSRIPPDASGAIRYALAQLGKPYLWGAVGPDSFDCSGLMMTAYSKGTGITIPRTTYQMIDDPGLMHINQGQLQPGDLVFPSRDHVQMYLGGGKVVEAPRSGIPVRIASLGKVYTARRVTTPSGQDYSGASPVSSTTPVGETVTGISASQVSQGVGVGLTNSFATIFKSYMGIALYSFEFLLGFGAIVAGLFLIARNTVMAGVD